VPDYSGIDWDQDVPTYNELRVAYAQSVIRARPLDTRIRRVVDHFNDDRTSARAAAAQFDVIDLDPALLFYLQRNRLPETTFFWSLFGSLDLLECVPEVGALRWNPLTFNDTYEGREIGPGQGMKLVNGWEAMASLASWLSNGAVQFDGPKPTDRETLRLTLGVAKAAFSGELKHTTSYRSFAPWSDWFDWEGFDMTLALVDRKVGRITVLMLTDGP